MGLVGSAFLLVAPGLLLLLALPCGVLPPRTVLPAAFILSPGVVAGVLAVAALLGMPFAVFAASAAIINPAAALIFSVYRRPSLSIDIPKAWLITPFLIIAPAVAYVIGTPFLREYGIENMLRLAS